MAIPGRGMTEDHGWLAADEWRTVVENVPIVSVDLVVIHDGGVVLGRRTNEPGAGEWFVPGGRVRKGERLEDAVHRVAREELGEDVIIDRRLGVDEHLWEASEFPDIDTKHHVTVPYVVRIEGGAFEPDDQHDALRVFRPPFEGLDLHPFVERYLRQAGVLDS